jgi:tetratricopeptide (TPR) repeat protein
MVTCFEYETAFRRNGHVSPIFEEALAFGVGLDRVLVNHGALQCLDAGHALLEPAGFFLINDYGPVQSDHIPLQSVSQRFGRTTALGVNFPLLQHHITSKGYLVIKPDDDDNRPIHTRLIVKTRLPGLIEAFGQQFGLEEQQAERLPEEARRHLEAGRTDEAMDCYKRALRRHPRDWRLLGEMAEFLIRSVADYEAGLAAARAAVRVNPWYSVWLWNTVGDALYAVNRFDEAHEAYLQGQRIDADDVRTNLNLAYTFCGFGRYREALDAIARGLAADASGTFRERLLEKQQNVLASVSARWADENEWLNRRAARLGS